MGVVLRSWCDANEREVVRLVASRRSPRRIGRAGEVIGNECALAKSRRRERALSECREHGPTHDPHRDGSVRHRHADATTHVGMEKTERRGAERDFVVGVRCSAVDNRGRHYGAATARDSDAGYGATAGVHGCVVAVRPAPHAGLPLDERLELRGGGGRELRVDDDVPRLAVLAGCVDEVREVGSECERGDDGRDSDHTAG